MRTEKGLGYFMTGIELNSDHTSIIMALPINQPQEAIWTCIRSVLTQLPLENDVYSSHINIPAACQTDTTIGKNLSDIKTIFLF